MREQPSFYYMQSAVIPYRYRKGNLEVLLITTRNHNWIIPKGIIENGMTPQESALNEAYEEAGIKGKINNKKVGSYSYEKWGDVCHVKVYPMKVTKVFDNWQEENFRERIWVSVDNAIEYVKNKDVKKILKTFANEIN